MVFLFVRLSMLSLHLEIGMLYLFFERAFNYDGMSVTRYRDICFAREMGRCAREQHFLTGLVDS